LHVKSSGDTPSLPKEPAFYRHNLVYLIPKKKNISE
jgi:hypothetical protein